MKEKDVKVGGKYYAVIGQELAAVIVVQVLPALPTSPFRNERRTRYRIRRENEDRVLPTSRTAAALREENKKRF